MTDAESLAELAAKAPKQPKALFYIQLDLRDIEIIPQGEDFPDTTYMGIPVLPASGHDYDAVQHFYNDKKTESDE